jgi:hypothetical protein
MLDYGKAKIYKLVCNVTGMVYIGSTIQNTLARRLSGHVCHYKQWLDGKHHYVSSFDILKGGDYHIVLIEDYPCASKDQLYARESYWTNEIVCVNKCKKQGKKIRLGKKEYHAQYHQENKEQSRKNYERNKEKILERNKQTYTCQCGSCIRISDKSHHIKSKKHQKYLEQQKQLENEQTQI